ncbi:ESF1 homolog isoform X2 [Trematomus bernacchii]|uniref:ESF1 homolog isoform X2 n=1 Tax=Trematomus bernacchii TaxID=40690 RepID=UPI00146BD48A|nr:ESF1 homolog isoform X2 [Trematomus bernacchii]
MSSNKKSGDERFLRVQKDPRFWEMPERERKIKIDKRFQSMFHDKRFTEKYTVDKRGRPINQTSTEDLKRFYNVSSSEDEDDDEEGVKSKKVAERKKKKKVKAEKEVKEKLVKVEKKVKESKDVTAKGPPPERGVRLIEEDDEEEDEEPETAKKGDVDLGDSFTDGSEDDDDDEDDDDEEGSDVASGSDEEESGLDSDSDSEPDLARGKGNVETSSDEDDEEYVNAILKKEEEEIEHDWGELAKDALRNDEVSARLGVCNMDWDRMKAKDLLALFNSFLPKGGAVLSVKIFPSEFGKQRLKGEETQGPMELKALPDDSEDDNEEERGYREKMRDYQFKRLKYFYAVVQCDTTDTAAKIYEECDGYEYESSCSVLDLRFIPEGVTFDDEPKDVATDVNLAVYTPKVFTSSANATSKVQLTWDETDNERVTALERNFNKDELLAMDFKAYLASSSEEEEEEGGFVFGEQESEDDDSAAEEVVAQKTKEPVVEKKPEKVVEKKEKKKNKSEEQISKYRELLKGIQEKERKLHEEKDMGMEITWVPGLKESTEQLVKKKLEGKETLTPWEGFLEKKKEKKKQKKTKKKEGEEEEEALSDDELPPDVDLNDPFFAEELNAADKQKTQKTQKGRNRKKKKEEERTPQEEEELQKQKAEMALLMEDDDDESKHKHFNYDKIVEEQNLSKLKKKKLLKKKGEEKLEGDEFQVDVKDPRFQAMFTSHLFNLDPSNPSYKKTKATQSIQVEKQRRREEEEQRRTEEQLRAQSLPKTQGEKRENENDSEGAETTSKKAIDPSLSLLIKSIKSKTEQFQARKKQKLM